MTFNKGMESITQAEHVSPDKTGDNIDAKRVVPYGWDGSNWQRQGLQLTPNKDYDYLDIQQTSSTVETYVYRIGGSSGTIIQTIVVRYVDSSKTDLNNIEWS